MFSSHRANVSVGFIVIFCAFTLLSPRPLTAQERYPTVARISFVSGLVTYSRGDDPDQWDDAIENLPLTVGDRLYSPEDGRAELQLSSGNFIRLAPRSYFSALNLSDDIKQFYLGEGAASFNIRRLRSDEVIEIDTPNVSVTLEQPGRYRIAVDEDGNSRISVRRGKAVIAASGRQIAVENREIRVYGIDSPRYEIVALPASDAFDGWVAERDARFDRAYSGASRYASEDIIAVEELSDYGRWEEIPEYGYAWTPTRVAAGWVPFSVGRWFWQDPWGWSWISGEPWGWATSHYGRWMPYRSRWYWVPVRPRTRVRYIPACVEFVRVRDHVGWFPLHPRDRFIPWWERRERQRFDRNIVFVNRTYVTVVNQNTFISARPVTKYIVRDSVLVREARSARLTSEPLPIPNRSSLRIVSETGERRHQRPPANVLSRAAVVRTAPPAPPPTFEEKLPEIQKRQGKPIDPSTAQSWASANDRPKQQRIAIRPAAVASSSAEFAPRTPAAAGPAPQPITPARGKKLATGDDAVATNVGEKAVGGEKSAAQQRPIEPAPSPSSKGIVGRPESPTPEQAGERQRQEKQALERERQAQSQQQRELERKQQEQQKEQERKAQLQKQQEQQLQKRQAQEQREFERRQAQQKEEERQSMLQKQQQEKERRQAPPQRPSKEQQRLEELERREQLRQQQLQGGQAQQQRQQELERREQQQERKAQAPQRPQDQERRDQVRQQQLQERQAQQQQKQQELDRRHAERRAQQQQNQERVQEQRQQQLQERQAQQQQRQQQPQRRQPEQQKESERKGPPPQKPPLQP